MSPYIPHGAAIPLAETTFQMREDCVRGHIMQQHGQARAYNIIVQLEIKLNSRYLHSTPKESIHFVTLRVLKRKDPLKPKQYRSPAEKKIGHPQNLSQVQYPLST